MYIKTIRFFLIHAHNDTFPKVLRIAVIFCDEVLPLNTLLNLSTANILLNGHPLERPLQLYGHFTFKLQVTVQEEVYCVRKYCSLFGVNI